MIEESPTSIEAGLFSSFYFLIKRHKMKGVIFMSVNYLKAFDFTKLSHYKKPGAVLPSPDQFVGTLRAEKGSYHFEPCQRDNVDYHNNGFTFESGKTYETYHILVILESPHRFEYNASNQPVGLVMGQTGYLFFSLFDQLLTKSKLSMVDRTYSVILANAIQYQTSCGLNLINRTIRDQNWLDIFEKHGGKADLKQRIFTIKPRYTINLCSGGKNPNGLRAKVSEALSEWKLIKGKHFTEGTHPASWRMEKFAVID